MSDLSNDLCISDKQILASWPHGPESITPQFLINGAFADPLEVLFDVFDPIAPAKGERFYEGGNVW
jgi:hypothetical protein